MSYRTEQEEFWAGEFGNDYIGRNDSEEYVASNTALFSKILSRTGPITKVIEFGSNVGLNLLAISRLLPNAALSAVEINEAAIQQLQKVPGVTSHHSSILDFEPDSLHDLALIKGVLIHINPDELDNVYSVLYRSSSRYICIAEYYNPSPVEIGYRGHEGRLFKRDFAGDIMDKYPDLKLVDYGFVYRRDTSFPQDDITWFLLEKS